MKLLVKEQIDLEELRQNLQKEFTDHKVKYPLFSKKMVRVIKGLSWVSIYQKKDELRIAGGINIMNMWFFIPFVLGLALGLIGGGAVILIFWLITRKKTPLFEQEVGNYIKEKYGLTDVVLSRA